MHDTAPETSIYGIRRSRPFRCLLERVIDLSEGEGLIPYMGKHVLLEDS